MARSGVFAAVLLLALLLGAAAPSAGQEVNPLDAAAAAAAAAPADASSNATKRFALALPKSYLTNAQLGQWADEFVGRCGGIARKFSVGKSARGVEFFGVEVSDKPGVDEAEPNFMYIGNMHGNEPSGRTVLPLLAEWLCDNNGKDARATRIVQGMHLYIIPTMNPDGFALRTRENANGVDLNRNFPDRVVDKGTNLRLPGPQAQPEVRAVMEFTLNKTWTASANLHEGAVVVNYPWDGYTSPGMYGQLSVTPDDATFKHLARTYARKHTSMSKSTEFPGGITNGAQWYDIYGGMQDWKYVVGGMMELTLEISNDKFVPAGQLARIWEQNQNALIALPITAALGGARGRVTSAATGAPVAATLTAVPASKASSKPDAIPFYSSPGQGFFARPLAPGRYIITATAPGFAPQDASVVVPAGDAGVERNFSLKPAK